jgi:hypothetical protein
MVAVAAVNTTNSAPYKSASRESGKRSREQWWMQRCAASNIAGAIAAGHQKAGEFLSYASSGILNETSNQFLLSVSLWSGRHVCEKTI